MSGKAKMRYFEDKIGFVQNDNPKKRQRSITPERVLEGSFDAPLEINSRIKALVVRSPSGVEYIACSLKEGESTENTVRFWKGLLGRTVKGLKPIEKTHYRSGLQFVWIGRSTDFSSKEIDRKERIINECKDEIYRISRENKRLRLDVETMEEENERLRKYISFLKTMSDPYHVLKNI